MLRSALGSIHDLDHAPEAPDVASLSSTPPSSPTSNKNLLSWQAHIDITEGSSSFVRRRSDTAPGRLDHVAESLTSGLLDPPNASTPAKNHLTRYDSYEFSEFDGYQDEQDDYLDAIHHDNSAPALEPSTKQGSNIFLAKLFKLSSEGHCFDCDISRMSVCLVRNAPCFWFCGSYMEVGATDRSILYRVNILCAFFAFGQVVAASLLLVVINSHRIVERYKSVVNRTSSSGTISLDLWNLNGSVFFFGMLGFVILITAIVTLKIVREVNLRGAVRYLWTLLWLLPLQIFVVISLFDYHRVTQVWVRHWWYLPSMAWFRQVFCANDTYNTLCVVPIGGGQNSTSEDEWCTQLFNATNCTEIRDTAQAEVARNMYIFYYSCGSKLIVREYFPFQGKCCDCPLTIAHDRNRLGHLLSYPTHTCNTLLGGYYYKVSLQQSLVFVMDRTHTGFDIEILCKNRENRMYRAGCYCR